MDVPSVEGSVLLVGVVSASSEIAVVSTILVVDVSFVGDSVLLLDVVSTSSELTVVSTILVDVPSVEGSVLPVGVV